MRRSCFTILHLFHTYSTQPCFAFDLLLLACIVLCYWTFSCRLYITIYIYILLLLSSAYLKVSRLAVCFSRWFETVLWPFAPLLTPALRNLHAYTRPSFVELLDPCINLIRTFLTLPAASKYWAGQHHRQPWKRQAAPFKADPNVVQMTWKNFTSGTCSGLKAFNNQINRTELEEFIEQCLYAKEWLTNLNIDQICAVTRVGPTNRSFSAVSFKSLQRWLSLCGQPAPKPLRKLGRKPIFEETLHLGNWESLGKN